MHDVVVFAGPSLGALNGARGVIVERLLDGCRLLPPAQRGDVLGVLLDKPRAILLIDGYYYGVPSVTHKELLYALDAGVRVLGAASMGALRAAELEAYGMTGVGTIFSWYQSGVLEGDDEVAVLHLDAEHGFRPTTVALVEVRHALGRLVLEPRAADGLLADLKEQAFVERTLSRTLALARQHLGAAAAEKLAGALEAESLKQQDALLALREARRLAENPPPPRRPDRSTVFLNAFRERYIKIGDGPTLAEAWHVVQVLHPQAPELVANLLQRFLLASAAHHAGLSPNGRQVEALASRLDEGLRARMNGRTLPRAELLEEAREILLARLAGERFGGPDAAIHKLERLLGFSVRGEPRLSSLLQARHMLWPMWRQVRAFLFSSVFLPAWAVAEAARQGLREFEEWSAGLRIVDEDLVRVAAELWRCEESAVAWEAERRGLAAAEGVYPGFQDALHLLAPNERRKEPGHDYARRKAELLATPIELAPLDVNSRFAA